jgi:hypothetical protein
MKVSADFVRIAAHTLVNSDVSYRYCGVMGICGFYTVCGKFYGSQTSGVSPFLEARKA